MDNNTLEGLYIPKREAGLGLRQPQTNNHKCEIKSEFSKDVETES